jgi:hypothetical protein
MEEAEKEGKADRFVDEWLSDVPPGEDPHEATREKVLAWKAKHADGPDYGFRCECGFSTRDTRYEAHVCPGAGPVGSEETTG